MRREYVNSYLGCDDVCVCVCVGCVTLCVCVLGVS